MIEMKNGSINWLSLINNWDKLLEKGIISLIDLMKFSKDNNFITIYEANDLERVFNTFESYIEGARLQINNSPKERENNND